MAATELQQGASIAGTLMACGVIALLFVLGICFFRWLGHILFGNQAKDDEDHFDDNDFHQYGV